ncbi:sigma-70 family RNA polymerase sigma factor [Pinibacter aurantiacus]|uniref:Sigma-70 family RNA polymerase sigma factor n=1 Tax=Pinibacter aurantiacus TaxID=2851599 RepID=A0A9E2W5A8_9BACT|nr:sigma-70 family RNA polymerase sigma factor [Pinibacter aurantiacus]MBV4360660.1 sigma-70 family RNA polymerase sigma factor [Pinibacter aurantiacus]
MKETSEQYSDLELIRLILSGDIALFELLIRRNNAILYKTGRSYDYGHEDTQDLMQETYIDAYRNLSKFEGRASFRTWITKIMLNKCFHHRHKLSFSNEVPSEISDKSIPMYSSNRNADTVNAVVNRELGLIVETALKHLSLDYRMVFSLREVNGFSVEETAETLGISEANVKTRLNRAKGMLRKEIEKHYQPEEIFEFNAVYCDAMVERVMRELRE